MFDLANFLPYLMNRAGVRLAVNFSEVLKPYDIGVQEWRVLAALHAHGTQRMLDLAKLTSIDRTTLSRLTARMEKAGFLHRGRVDQDGREVRIAASGLGQKVTSELLPHARRYEEVAVAGLNSEEVEQLKSMLAKVYDNLDAL